MKEVLFCLFLFLISTCFIIPSAESSSFKHPAFARYGACRKHTDSDDSEIKKVVPGASPILVTSKSKGFLGTVGVLGGSIYNSAPAYFAAMAALRVGADAAHIICTGAVGSALQSLVPDIVVHPLIDVSHEKLMKRIESMDVVVIGPGMDTEYGASAAVIHRVIDYCKLTKKPLVLDLEPFFLTPTLLSHLQNYPAPGFIMLMNNVEFETFYKLIKSPNTFSDAHIDVDFKKLGDNVLIYRKGCTDIAFTSNVKSSWTYGAVSTSRRTAGQGDIIAGATAVYFYWAVNSINDTNVYGPMLPASVATYQAATMMRNINNKAYQHKGKGAVTTDMLDCIPETLYGSDY